MNSLPASPDYPAPPRHGLTLPTMIFILVASPCVWFLQLCGDYVLASAPCFRASTRLSALPPSLNWTASAMSVLMIAAVLVCILSFVVSWRIFQRTRTESEGDGAVREYGVRTCFVALWGMLLGAGFAFASVLSTVAMQVLPSCAG